MRVLKEDYDLVCEYIRKNGIKVRDGFFKIKDRGNFEHHLNINGHTDTYISSHTFSETNGILATHFCSWYIDSTVVDESYRHLLSMVMGNRSMVRVIRR